MSPTPRIIRLAGIILIQLVLVAVLVGALEFGARRWEPSFKRPQVDLQLLLRPYMMFSSGPGRDLVWQDILSKKPVPSTMEFNNFGFAERFDYNMVPDATYLAAHGKKPGERIVLITGGSVVHGVGATSNDATIAGQMMRHLNERSGGPRYRVINMGMGSWIAYQQFIGLSLFGLPFDPDWVVVMDGHNDAAVPCVHGSGVGNPLGWPKMLYLTQGGTGAREVGPVMASLSHRSALVRLLTGIKPAEIKEGLPAGLVFDREDPDPRFLIKMEKLTFAAQDRQMTFYLQSERNVLALFPRANVILSSQPLMYDNAISPAYRPAFDPRGRGEGRAAVTEQLDRFMAENGATRCSSKHSSQLLGYFMARSAMKLEELALAAQKADGARHIGYWNIEWVFPPGPDERKQFFVDNAHMSDLGQERVGDFYAEAILSADQGRKFDYAAFVTKRFPPAAPGDKPRQ
jgi:hypothetical protein